MINYIVDYEYYLILFNKFAMDSEHKRMTSFVKARDRGTDGFQGCVNLGKGCTFKGYYLASYSSEGLCHCCEVDAYPERFQGCMFCRRPQDYGCCLTCGSAFSKWLEETIVVNVPLQFGFLHHMIWRLTEDVETIVPFLPEQHQRNRSFYEWPGFYVGNNRWVLKDIQLELNEELTWETGHEVLQRLLLANGIDIYGEIQMKEE